MRLCGGAFARIFQNLDDCDKLSLRLGTNVAFMDTTDWNFADVQAQKQR